MEKKGASLGPERVSVLLPLPARAVPRVTGRTVGPLPGAGRIPPLVFDPLLPGVPGPRPGLHPARRCCCCCCGRRRGAGRAAVLSAARPERRFAEPRRRVLRGRERPLAGRRALGGGRPGAASSSAAASSRCSVSREPRLVDAESLSSAAASSLRCKRTSAWLPKPSEPAAGTSRDLSPPPPGPSRLAFLDSSLGKKMVPAAGEVSGGRWPPAAGAVTCGGGRVERAGRGGGPDSWARGGARRVPAKLAEPPGFARARRP